MELKLKQFVPSQKCLRCDICCRFTSANSVWSPILTDFDIARLTNYPVNLELLSNRKTFKLQPYGCMFICPFFEVKDNYCKIYNLRPIDCQLYPFLLAKKDKKVFLSYDRRCPFMKDKQNSAKLKNFISYLIEFLEIDDIKTIIKNNPQIIADYKNEVIFLKELNFL
jgi:hypothetical protein